MATPGPVRQLTSHAAAGASTSNVLRFAPIAFASAGTYKVCFCSSKELGTLSKACATEADFKVELGKVHVTGVSMLLEKHPKFRRKRCYTQYHGGLSCAVDSSSWSR